MDGWKLVTIHCLLWIFFASQDVAAYCSWPEFLYPGSTWNNHISRGGHALSTVTVGLIAVDGMALDFRYDLDTRMNFRWTCESPFHDNRNIYLVSRTSLSDSVTATSTDNAEFLCVRFEVRGENVIQLETSVTWINNPDVDLCGTTRLQPIPWLLIKVGTLSAHSCPFTGGFNIRFYDKNMREYCPGVYNPARFESGCDTRDDIVIDFQDCPHDRLADNMRRIQSFKCFSHWTQEGFLFLILFNQENSGLWVLRAPENIITTSQVVYTAVLFSDTIYDPANATQIVSVDRYTIMEMDHVIYDSLCSDAALTCLEDSVDKVCATDNMFGHIFCKKTCGNCPENPHPCEFEQHLQTLFRPLHARANLTNSKFTKSTLFSIARDYVEVGKYGQLQCISHDVDFGYNRYALVQTQPNGCTPRFHCLLLDTLIESNFNDDVYRGKYDLRMRRLVAYKLQQGAIWPDYERSFYCNARVMTSSLPDPPWDFAVVGSRRLKPSPCELPHLAYNLKDMSNPYDVCEGTLQKVYCSHDSTEFRVSYDNCRNRSDENRVTYRCLSKIDHHYSEAAEHAQIIVIQSTVFHNLEYMCLILQPRSSTVWLMKRKECLNFYFYEEGEILAEWQLTGDDSLCDVSMLNPVAHSYAPDHRLPQFFQVLFLCIVFSCCSFHYEIL